MKRRILQIGNPASPLNAGMGLAAQSDQHQIYWFSPFKGDLPGVQHFVLRGELHGAQLCGEHPMRRIGRLVQRGVG